MCFGPLDSDPGLGVRVLRFEVQEFMGFVFKLSGVKVQPYRPKCNTSKNNRPPQQPLTDHVARSFALGGHGRPKHAAGLHSHVLLVVRHHLHTAWCAGSRVLGFGICRIGDPNIVPYIV